MTITFYFQSQRVASKDMDVDMDISQDDYIKQLEAEFRRSSDAFSELMSNSPRQVNQMQKTAGLKKVEYSFVPCKGKLFIGNNVEVDVDYLIEIFAKRQRFQGEIRLDYTTMSEEFEEELKDWENTHQNVKRVGLERSKEWIEANIPLRDIYVMFKNKANEDVFGVLRAVKLQGHKTLGVYNILAEDFNLVDDFRK